MTIKELALAKCPPLKSTNPKNRSRAMSRFFGYQQGALDALKEIETRIEMGRHSSMQTSESILASVEMTIKELKGVSKELDELNKAIWESMSKEQRIKQTFHLMALRASIAVEAITRSRLNE